MTNRQAAERILSLIDLTNLNDVCTDEEVVELCTRAHGEFGTTAAVCVWPRFVDLSASHLKHTSIKVATVVNFPHGGTDVAVVANSPWARVQSSTTSSSVHTSFKLVRSISAKIRSADR